MVEFVAILVPLMTLFLCMIELSRLGIAHLLLERAAGMAVRACAVIKDQPKNCDVGSAEAERLIQRAATEGLRPWTDTHVAIDRVECRTKKPSGEDVVQVRAQFRCIVPIARNIICSTSQSSLAGATAGVSSRAVGATARYAHQGASFDCNYAKNEVGFPGLGSEPIDLPALGGAWP